MVEGVRYGGSVAEVGAAGWLGGQVGTTHSWSAHCCTECCTGGGQQRGTASRPLAVLSLLIAASRIARYRRGIRRRDCRARPSGEENLAQKSLLAGI